MSADPRVVFAGTPAFAVPSLERLIASGVDVTQVLTQPDRPAGRGRRLAPSPVKTAAEKAGIPVHEPEALGDEAILERLGSRPELLVVVAYGLLLPGWMLDWPVGGAVNVHASLLPRWRGAAPIQRAILAGDVHTGVSIMRMELGLDTGPVFARRAVEIGREDTAGALHDRLAVIGAELLVDTLPGILSGELQPEPQDGSAATYAAKIKKAEGELDWSLTAEELEKRVRAFNPWPVCVGRLSDDRTLRILAATAEPGETADAPGAIVAAGADGIEVATGGGRLRLRIVQPPGGVAMPAADYLNAHSLRGASFV
ncbi:MAG TPA: methionyl-tRNA formyltransferase [Gammaproteobacteria bacterium]